LKSNKGVLLIIVFSQFCCTSLWFAGNGVMSDLTNHFSLDSNALGHLTSSVQLGFILGTLVFALFTIADRFSPSKVFFISALLGALFNLGIIWNGNDFASLIAFRFITGFFLAGIYPVGMKIAADYFDKDLGKSLGYLVGALVLGTAFPHLLKEFTHQFPWQSVIISTSILALIGGLIMLLLIADGPYRKASQQIDMTAIFKVFKKEPFRSGAFGYFGHMWELYAFWAFVPVMLAIYNTLHQTNFNIPLMSFIIIGIGGLASVLGGYLSQLLGTKRTAFIALSLSGICCLVSPFIFAIEVHYLFVLFLVFWGVVVIADSPLFSTLVAQNAPVSIKGTALTIVNCIGFSITIISIQLLSFLRTVSDSNIIFGILVIGPFLGLIALSRNDKNMTV